MEIDRISPITNFLDEVFYKSSIVDMREFYFSRTKKEKQWLLFSDYYLDYEKPNNVITFTALPHVADLAMLQEAIKAVAPTDIKHTKAINEKFVDLINSIPAVNIIFSFDKKKYYLWDTSDEVKSSMLEYIEVLKAYVVYWKENDAESTNRLDRLSKNIRCLESSLKAGKKIRLIAGMFLISLLGGYVGSLLCRETNLSSLMWLSDRDSTNEICNNLIRDLFQITLIDITKKNIQFSFTTSNSTSDEWYAEMTRIPDYLTGTVSSFDFTKGLHTENKVGQMLGLHFRYNITNTFIYRFTSVEGGTQIKRMLIT